MKERRQRWWLVVVFAIAMSWVEAAVVLYLRTLVGRIDPYQPRPLPEMPGLTSAEIIREGATMIMLGSVGWLAGRRFRSSFGYLLIAFGIWDIFYYIFLKILTGWPHGLLDWDILFLIPLPWWGPVIAPVLVAALMILTGTLLTSERTRLQPTRRSIAFAALGVLLILGSFMYDALALCLNHATVEIIRNWLPHSFAWPLFLPGLLLASFPALELALRNLARNGLHAPINEPTTL